LSVRDLSRALAALTPEQRALFARRLEESGWDGGVQEILPRPATGAPVVTSLMQQRLWILGEMEPGNPFYNLPILCFRLRGALRPAALAQCFREIERRHESLRTVFAPGDPIPLQVIQPAGERAFPLVDLSALPPARREETAWELAREEGRVPFDLGRGPLWWTSLIRLSGSDHLLLVTMHHIISDAWSLGVFYRELGVLYRAFARGLPSPLPEPQIQYADFALWQRRQLQGERLEAEIGFWRGQLAGAPDLLELPTDRPRPSPRTYDGSRLTTWFSPQLAEGIAGLSAGAGASLYMVLLAAFATVLHRWTGQDDVVLGAPVAGRTHVATEGLIGFFVNTVAFRVRLAGDPTCRELIRRTRDVVLDVYEHQELPFDRLVEGLKPRRNPAYSPVFQAMISLQNTPTPDLEMPGLEVTALGINTGTSQTDLIVFAGMERGRLGLLHLEYNTDLFDQPTMQRMEGHLLRLLSGAVADPERRLSLLPLLSAAEEHQLCQEMGAAGDLVRGETPAAGPCLHELFAARARRRPAAVAVTSGSLSLTYAELERRANALAHHLSSLGVKPETRVGICVERGPEMLIGLLGILKAGGAYVPLDPAYPAERLAFLVDDALGGQESPVLLVGEGLGGRFVPSFRRPSQRTVELSGDLIAREADHPPPVQSLPGNAAYVIYTSGSTGRPKGVVNTHANVARFLESAWRQLGITAEDVCPLFHSFVFDFSVWEIFGTLLSGGRLVVVPRELVRSPEGFLRLLAAEGVTVLNQTPAALYELAAVLGQEDQGSDLPALRLVLAGGDTLDLSRLAGRWAGLGGRLPLVNVYGITETTVLSTFRPLERGGLNPQDRSPIGRPFAGISLHLLGRRGERVPLGVAGEIHLGGGGLARGYLGRPELTAERFVPDPFATEPGARLYRSGDMARRLNGGDLEYLGRIDQQVKVRGFRIELGEIEAALARHPGVRECAAAVREPAPGDRGIAAWYVPAPASSPGAAELRAFLEQALPAHMIPALFTAVAALPWNASGKVDRNALPAPDRAGSAAGGDESAAPRTPLEEGLAELWRELLGIEHVGRDDDFFALGGHSLLATRLISRLRDRLQIEVPPQLVFETPRLAALAHALEAAREAGIRPQAPALLATPRRVRRTV
jgi:amino acid adenylation domain-containing protein